jgi:hypothetical protein
MVVRTRPPQTPVMPRSVAGAPRRWPKRLLALVIALTITVLVVAALWLRKYQPLTTGSGSFSVQPSRLVTGSFDANGWHDGSFTQYELRMVRDTTYRVGFPVWNEGRLPVTILGLSSGSAGDPGDAVTTALAGTTSMDGGQQGRATTPFGPFTLQPGEGVELFVDIHVKSAAFDTGTAVGLNTVVLDYRVAWMHSQATVFFGMSINICKPTC